MNSQALSILVNGLPNTSIDLEDRGLCYGHGVFETIRVTNKQPTLWQLHIDRLKRGCFQLKIDLPGNIESRLHEDISHLLEHTDINHSILKITITAGKGRGYKLPADHQYQRIVAHYPLVEYPDSLYTQGVEVLTCAYRLPENRPLAGLKHLNRLDQVIARSEWDNETITEGIMLDNHGIVVEGVMTNLFGYKDSQLITPALDKAGVQGTMRDYLLACAHQQGIDTEEVSLTENVFKQSKELFICNSVMGVVPIIKWGEKVFKVGPITRTLQSSVKQLFYGQPSE